MQGLRWSGGSGREDREGGEGRVTLDSITFSLCDAEQAANEGKGGGVGGEERGGKERKGKEVEKALFTEV